MFWDKEDAAKAWGDLLFIKADATCSELLEVIPQIRE